MMVELFMQRRNILFPTKNGEPLCKDIKEIYFSTQFIKSYTFIRFHGSFQAPDRKYEELFAPMNSFPSIVKVCSYATI